MAEQTMKEVIAERDWWNSHLPHGCSVIGWTYRQEANFALNNGTVLAIAPRHLAGLLAIREEQDALRARIGELEQAVTKARDTFRHYGDLHAAKPDEVKAKRNYDLADEMQAALSGEREG